MLSPLPPEIVDAIIGFLHTDSYSLSNCGLVCKTWLPSSRYHLFRSVSLLPSNIADFIALLVSPCITFATFVENLEITSIPESTILDNGVTRLLDLTEIKSLRIHNLVWSAAVKPNFLCGFKGLKELELSAIDFKIISELLGVICAFPLLETLSLEELGWEDPSFEGPTSSGKYVIPSNLVTFKLGNCYKRDILNWFLACDTIPLLRTLDLGIVHEKDTPAIGEYLRALGTTLRTLSFGFSHLDAGGDAEDFCSFANLCHNTELRSIRIHNFINSLEYQLTSAVNWIPTILSQVSSPLLEEVTFSVVLSRLADLDGYDHPIDWPVFDRLFTEPQFANLQQLGFLIYGDVDQREVSVSIANKLPICSERGILTIDLGLE